MDATNISLLEHHQGGVRPAWDRLFDLYSLVSNALQGPVLAAPLRRGIDPGSAPGRPPGAEDLRPPGAPGVSVAGCTTITANRARAYWKAGKHRPSALGGFEFQLAVEQLEDPHGEGSRRWDREQRRARPPPPPRADRGRVRARKPYPGFPPPGVRRPGHKAVAAELTYQHDVYDLVAKSRVLARLAGAEGRGLAGRSHPELKDFPSPGTSLSLLRP